MTWGGAQGFQTPIEEESFTVKNMGVYGNMHTERKLTCKRDIPLQLARGIAYLCVPLRLLDVEFFFSGHMTPRMYISIEVIRGNADDILVEFVPWAAFNTMSYLLGRQDSPSS